MTFFILKKVIIKVSIVIFRYEQTQHRYFLTKNTQKMVLLLYHGTEDFAHFFLSANLSLSYHLI